MIGQKRRHSPVYKSTGRCAGNSNGGVQSASSQALVYSCIKYEKFFHYYTCTGVLLDKAGFISRNGKSSSSNSLVYSHTLEPVSVVVCDEQSDSLNAHKKDCELDMLIDDNALRTGLSQSAQASASVNESFETTRIHEHRRKVMENINVETERYAFLRECLLRNDFNEPVDADRPTQMLSGNLAMLILSNAVLCEMIGVYAVPIPQLRRTKLQFFWCVRETKVPYSPFMAKWMLENCVQRTAQLEHSFEKANNDDDADDDFHMTTTQPPVGLYSFGNQLSRRADTETLPLNDGPSRVVEHLSGFVTAAEHAAALAGIDIETVARKTNLAAIEALCINDGEPDLQLNDLSPLAYVNSDVEQQVHSDCMVDESLCLSASYAAYGRRHRLRHANADVFKTQPRHPKVSCNELYVFNFCTHDLRQYCAANRIVSAQQKAVDANATADTLCTEEQVYNARVMRCLFGNRDMLILDAEIQSALQGGGTVVYSASNSRYNVGSELHYRFGQPRVASSNCYSLAERCSEVNVQLLLSALLHKVALLEVQAVEPIYFESPYFALENESGLQANPVEQSVVLSEQQTRLLEWITQREEAIYCQKTRSALTHIVVSSTGWVYNCRSAEFERTTADVAAAENEAFAEPNPKRRRKAKKTIGEAKHQLPLPAAGGEEQKSPSMYRVEAFCRGGGGDPQIERTMFSWCAAKRRIYKNVKTEYNSVVVSGGPESGKRTALWARILRSLSANWLWADDCDKDSHNDAKGCTIFGRRAKLPVACALAFARMSSIQFLHMQWTLFLRSETDDDVVDDAESRELQADNSMYVFRKLVDRLIDRNRQNESITFAHVCRELWLANKMQEVHRIAACAPAAERAKAEKRVDEEVTRIAYCENYINQFDKSSLSYSHLVSRATLIVCGEADVDRWLRSASIFATDDTLHENLGKQATCDEQVDVLQHSPWHFVRQTTDARPDFEPIDAAIFCIRDEKDWGEFTVARFLLADVVIITYETLENINAQTAPYLFPFARSLGNFDEQAYCGSKWMRCVRQHTAILQATPCLQFTKTNNDIQSMRDEDYESYVAAQQVPVVAVRWDRVIVANYVAAKRYRANLLRPRRTEVSVPVQNFLRNVQAVRKVFVETEPIHLPTLTRVILPLHVATVRHFLGAPMLPKTLEPSQYHWDHLFCDDLNTKSHQVLDPQFVLSFTRQMHSFSAMKTHAVRKAVQSVHSDRYETLDCQSNPFIEIDREHLVLVDDAMQCADLKEIARLMHLCQRTQLLCPLDDENAVMGNLDTFFTRLGRSSTIDMYMGALRYRSPSSMCLMPYDDYADNCSATNNSTGQNSAINSAQQFAVPMHIFFDKSSRYARFVRLLDRFDPISAQQFSTMNAESRAQTPFVTTQELKQTYRSILLAVAHSPALAKPIIDLLTQMLVYNTARRLSVSCRSSTDAPEYPIVARNSGSESVLQRVERQMEAVDTNDAHPFLGNDGGVFVDVDSTITPTLADSVQASELRSFARNSQYSLMSAHVFSQSMFADSQRADPTTGLMRCGSVADILLYDTPVELLSNGSAVDACTYHVRVSYVDRCALALCESALNGSELQWSELLRDRDSFLNGGPCADAEKTINSCALNDPNYFAAAAQTLLGADEQLLDSSDDSAGTQYFRIFRNGTCADRRKLRKNFVYTLTRGIESYLSNSFGFEWYTASFLSRFVDGQKRRVSFSNDVSLSTSLEDDDWLSEPISITTPEHVRNEGPSQRNVVAFGEAVGAQQRQTARIARRYLLTEKNLLYELYNTQVLLVTQVRVLDEILANFEPVRITKLFPLLYRLDDAAAMNAFYKDKRQLFADFNIESSVRNNGKLMTKIFAAHLQHFSLVLQPLIEMLIRNNHLNGTAPTRASQNLQDLLQAGDDADVALFDQCVGVCKTSVPLYLQNMIVKIMHESRWIRNDLDFIQTQRRNALASLPSLEKLKRATSDKDREEFECPVCMDTLADVDQIALYPCGHMCCYSCYTQCNSETHLPTLHDGMVDIGIAHRNTRCCVCRYQLQKPEVVVCTTMIDQKLESLDNVVRPNEPERLDLLQDLFAGSGQGDNGSSSSSGITIDIDDSDSSSDSSSSSSSSSSGVDFNEESAQSGRAQSKSLSKTKQALSVIDDILHKIEQTGQHGAPIHRIVVVSNYDQQLIDIKHHLNQHYGKHSKLLVNAWNQNEPGVEKALAEAAWFYAKIPVVFYCIRLNVHRNVLHGACLDNIYSGDDNVEHILLLEPPLVQLVDDRAAHVLAAQIEQRLLSRFANQFSTVKPEVHRFVLVQDERRQESNTVDTQVDLQWYRDTRWYNAA